MKANAIVNNIVLKSRENILVVIVLTAILKIDERLKEDNKMDIYAMYLDLRKYIKLLK